MSTAAMILLLILSTLLSLTAAVMASFGLMGLWGAPYVGTPTSIARRMIRLAEGKEGETLLDLGSGSGSILIVAAKEFGMRGIGYELNPFLRVITKLKARVHGVGDRIEVRSGNVFHINLPEAEVITLFLLPAMVESLRAKIIEQAGVETRIIARDFYLQNWPHYAEDGWLRAYRKSDVL